MVDLVRFQSARPEANLAFDEALLRAGPAGTVLRVWRNPPCVVLGRGQRPEREVDRARCAADGVPVLRRASGGGTVYHDLGNVNVTLVLPGTRDPLHRLGELMADVVAGLGLRPALGERGVFVDGRKLCGFAALRTRGAVLAHSTLLVSTPLDRVSRYLVPAPAVGHPLDSHRSPVTSLVGEGLAAPVSRELDALLARYAGPLRERRPASAETRSCQDLMRTRYAFPPWHREGRQRPAGGHAPGRNREIPVPKEEVWTARRASTSTG